MANVGRIPPRYSHVVNGQPCSPVHGGSALVDLSDLVALSSVVKDALGGGCLGMACGGGWSGPPGPPWPQDDLTHLASVNVGHDTDVPVLVEGELALGVCDGGDEWLSDEGENKWLRSSHPTARPQRRRRWSWQRS